MPKAKKTTTKSSGEKKMIFNLEVVIVILVGAIVLLSLALFILYQQRELISDELSNQQDLTYDQDQQIHKFQMQLEQLNKTDKSSMAK